MVESLAILNEHSDNVYHRMHMVGRQLEFLVVACALLVSLALVLSFYYAPANSLLGCGHLVPVALAGALGAVASAMYQLSRVGQAKIPDALLHGLITPGRPVVGAASALFIYVVIQSDVISLIDASKVSLEAGMVLGFVAGVSEKFVLSTVARVAGRDADDTVEGVEPIEALDNGLPEKPGTPPEDTTKPPSAEGAPCPSPAGSPEEQHHE